MQLNFSSICWLVSVNGSVGFKGWDCITLYRWHSTFSVSMCANAMQSVQRRQCVVCAMYLQIVMLCNLGSGRLSDGYGSTFHLYDLYDEGLTFAWTFHSRCISFPLVFLKLPRQYEMSCPLYYLLASVLAGLLLLDLALYYQT